MVRLRRSTVKNAAEIEQIQQSLTRIEQERIAKRQKTGKPFHKMNTTERKDRIDYLWGLVRASVFAKKFVMRTSMIVDKDWLHQFS